MRLVVKMLSVVHALVVLPVVAGISYVVSREGVVDRGPAGSVVRYGADAFWLVFVPPAVGAVFALALVALTVWVLGRLK